MHLCNSRPLTQQGGQPNEYCEICRHHGHSLRHCPILQKYTSVPNMVYYEFCGSTTHTAKQCHALDALADRLDHSSFRIDEAPQGFGGGVAEVEELSEEAEMVTEDPLTATTVMNRATLQGTTHIRGDHGVHTIETIPMLLRIVLT
jgi:hypothetical protein